MIPLPVCNSHARSSLPLLRAHQQSLLNVPSQSRSESGDRSGDAARVSAQVVPGASSSEGPDLNRRGVLQALAADAEGRADATEVQHADQIWVPIRLRALSGPRAAFVPDAG